MEAALSQEVVSRPHLPTVEGQEGNLLFLLISPSARKAMVPTFSRKSSLGHTARSLNVLDASVPPPTAF